MARNPLSDNARSVLCTLALQGVGWNTDPYRARTVADWSHRYPLVPIVADGRPCEIHRRDGVISPDDPRAQSCDDCYTTRGRGTTLIDLTRRVDNGGLLRSDFLSVKTGKIGSDGKFPSRIDLGTGNPETIAAIVDAAERGSSIPVIFWISENDAEGEPSEHGYAIFVDVAPFIREYGSVPVSDKPYGRGQAPPCYVALSSRRICGVPGGNKGARKAVQLHEQFHAELPVGKWMKRAENWEGPHFDKKGRYWSKPYAVHYSELRISLSACGITRDNWIPCHVSDLPGLVDKQDWNALSF